MYKEMVQYFNYIYDSSSDILCILVYTDIHPQSEVCRYTDNMTEWRSQLTGVGAVSVGGGGGGCTINLSLSTPVPAANTVLGSM